MLRTVEEKHYQQLDEKVRDMKGSVYFPDVRFPDDVIPKRIISRKSNSRNDNIPNRTLSRQVW